MNKVAEYLPAEQRWYGRMLPRSLKQLRLVPLGDVHFGSPLFSLHHLDKCLKFIESNEDVFTVLMGDLCDSTLRDSIGDVYGQTRNPQEQRDFILGKIMPIKGKVLGMVSGNHEARIYNRVGVDISRDIANELECPYRPDGLLLKVSFGGGNSFHEDAPYTYWVYATHGYGGARTKSAKAVKVERVATFIQADLYLMAHDHVANVAPDIYLLPDNRGTVGKDGFTTGKVVAKRKMLVKTNAYAKWGGYSEAGGFSPSDLEFPVIHFAGEGKPMVRVLV